MEVVSELETKLKGVKEQLEDEKHNCRSVVTYCTKIYKLLVTYA